MMVIMMKKVVAMIMRMIDKDGGKADEMIANNIIIEIERERG